MRDPALNRPGRFAVLAALLSAATVAGGSGLPARAAPAAPAAATTTSRAAAVVSRDVLLITGDELAVRSQGSQRLIADRSPAKRDPMLSMRHGSTITETPVAALPYLGRGLSPSLFQLATLEKAESHGRLPVRVSYTGRLPMIPGLTLTATGTGSATGYLTAASGPAFGAALLRQYTADHAAGRYGTDGLFGHNLSITPAVSGTVAAARAQPAARPGYKMHTLTVHGANLAGKADTGDSINVYSADNFGKGSGPDATSNVFYHGATKFSLPAGHYWAIATFYAHENLRMVVVPQFRVAGDHSVLRVAEKSASSKVTFSTPRRASGAQESLNIIRGEQNGQDVDLDSTWVSPVVAWVSPTTRKVSVGTLRTYTSGTLLSPATAGHYVYNLDYAGPSGIIPPQHFSTGPLAQVTERYYLDVASHSTSGWLTFGGTAAELRLELALDYGLPMPSVQTQYFTATPGIYWQNEAFTDQGLAWASGYSDDPHVYQPGQHTQQEWNRYPLHAGDDTTVQGGTPASPVLSSAARVGDELELHQLPWSDNQPGHLGLGFSGYPMATGSYVIHQGGHRIAHGNAVSGIPLVKLSAKPATVTYTLRASRPESRTQLSPGSTTTWTWRTKRDPAARVPKAWYCAVNRQHQPVRTCAVQPLLTLQYLVRGEAMNGRTAPGRQKITLNVGHLQLGGSAAITGATAKVSFNRGDTWIPATVTGQAGHYTVVFTAPAGGDVSLQVHATDAHGGSITETLIRAWGVRK